MRKAGVFVTGLVGGAVALPSAFIFVRPVRKAIVNGVLNGAKKHLANLIENDHEFRQEMIEVGSEGLAGLIIIEEAKKTASNNHNYTPYSKAGN